MTGNMLLVSSDRHDVSVAQSAAAEEAVRTIVTKTYRDAVTTTAKEAIALILCEDALPDGNWKDLLGQIVMIPEPPPLVVVADPDNRALWTEAINLGAYDVIAKPIDQEEALHVVVRALASTACHWYPSGRIQSE